MRITESQLRKIVREEIIRESSPFVGIVGMGDRGDEMRIRGEIAELVGQGLSPLEAAEKWMAKWTASFPARATPSHEARLAQRKLVYGIVTDPNFIRNATRTRTSGWYGR